MNGGPLESIFIFYSKLQKPGVQRMKKGLTFDEVSQANTTLSFFEFLCAVRDFDLVPNLVTKNDVNSIWKWCKSRRGRRSTPESVISELEFPDFVEILCCVSLVAFPDVGGEEAVGLLIKFMRLDEPRYVHNQISTRGMETSARFNYRSKGETDPMGGQRLRDERDRERAALLVSRKRGGRPKHPREGDVKFKGWNDEDTIRGSRYLGDDTRRIWEETREVALGGGGETMGSVGGAEFEQDDDITEGNYEEDGYFDETLSRSTRRTEASRMTARTTDTAFTSFWSGKSTTTKKTLGVDHAELLKESYNESMTKILLPYKFKNLSDKKPLWTEFKGPYMDFGITSRWRRGGYRAVISVVNSGDNPILITPEAYRFDKDGDICWGGDDVGVDSDDDDGEEEADLLDVAFEPSVIPPGLRTIISVTLSPNFSKRDELLGGINLEVSLVPREQGNINYRHPKRGTEMKPKSSLRDHFFVRVPIYSAFVDDKFGDQVGSFECKENLIDSGVFKRKGIRVKGARSKAEEVKRIEDENDGWA
ncbi:hypothetical protein TrRE_jg6278 [Triparma retinervis]|uniref:Uncharacterized protein n=1 Tax=Triparma retinervis TaxID=2557542 RepID=A0A9W7CMS5_9STRA|nr:hypothetical protein TrRE_jg6278 [Triparma retinervis]